MILKPYSGIWPVAPTPFLPTGAVDYDGMKRVLNLMIDQGVDGICILANFSEQFLISDAEREQLTRVSLEHVAGRVPVIVTISHFETDIGWGNVCFQIPMVAPNIKHGDARPRLKLLERMQDSTTRSLQHPTVDTTGAREVLRPFSNL